MYIPVPALKARHMYIIHLRQVTRIKSKSGAVVKYQRMFVVLKSTSNVKQHFKTGAAPLYRSLVTSMQKLFLGKKDSFPDAAINQD